MKLSTYCSLLLIKSQFDDFVGDVTFQNHFINALCEIKVWRTSQPVCPDLPGTVSNT